MLQWFLFPTFFLIDTFGYMFLSFIVVLIARYESFLDKCFDFILITDQAPIKNAHFSIPQIASLPINYCQLVTL